MILRSLLFVPGDRPDRIEKALLSGADAVILDLEDSVTPARKPLARDTVAAILDRPDRRITLFVRINPLDGDQASLDLAAIAGGSPDGIVLPKAEGRSSIADLAARLTELGDHKACILPIATETPAAMFRLGEYGGVTERLVGITWGAEDLPAAIGATTAREADGRYTHPYQLARSLTLFAAAAAGVDAIETVYPAFTNLIGLSAYAGLAARDGFTGMMAIHPAQVEPIHAAFVPSGAAIEQARAIVAAFAANPDAGTLAVGGRMVDTPHLRQARRVLARDVIKN